MPDLSILVPSFNSERFLPAALDSVASALSLAPSLEVEVLIQDGGSTDGTAEVAGRSGLPLQFVSEPDDGQADALQRALKRATSEWVLWLNSDDLVVPEAFANFLSLGRRFPEADVLHGGYVLFDEAGDVLRRYPGEAWDRRRLFLLGNYIFSGSTVFRRSYLEELGFDSRYQYVMDLELFLRVDARRTGHGTDPIGGFRYWQGSKSGGEGRRFISEAAYLRKALVSTGDFPRKDYLRAQALMRLSQATLRLRRTRGWSRIRVAVGKVAARVSPHTSSGS